MLFNNHRLFKSIEIEISTRCNLRCPFCPVSKVERKPAELPLAIIEKIVNELSEIGYDGVFSPHFYNEPLLDARLDAILEMVKRVLPRVTTLLFTNFTLMTPERYRELLPHVDEFVVSVDEPVIQKSVDRVMPLLSEEERSKTRVRYLSEGAMSNRLGLVQKKELVCRRKTCRLGCDYFVVDAYGGVHLCCNDFEGRAVFGNVHNEGVMEIWNKKEFRNARKKALKARHHLCRNCFWNQGPDKG
jgi:radical SAM protein with 4Fe4S-binding SPASM domain